MNADGAQADPGLCGDRRGRARQPGAGGAAGRGQHLQRRVRRQRLSVGRDRGETQGAAVASRIHATRRRGHPLSKAQAAANHAKSRIRARIEHVFGAQETAPGGRIVRTIGIVRARAKIGLQNLVYNIRRLVTLERIAAV